MKMTNIQREIQNVLKGNLPIFVLKPIHMHSDTFLSHYGICEST